MLVKAQKWGNSLAVRLPKGLADECGIEANSPIEIVREENTLVIRPLTRKASLESLLAQVTEDNLHGEVETGPPAGRELW
ncbi:AbrB/MazE/SpoVT family DNA-binding domain-containing protein [Geomonas sp.]|uniref:AbrB/MazE/SpoVT family DNA-binding domain-containing protein n=1 Tax=Geomonas sp. TaxID=2651584 RepID=UPI002B459F3C|nr:AbrB/MazE/SpoVT family DNA-binding domain-containing protein [Geomonas sp.]HJV33961.1 AbrB/MazE/SpoVT family DNA-binding domain-containing protein [Geomonas sp.]